MIDVRHNLFNRENGGASKPTPQKLVFKIAFKNALRIKLGVDGLLNHKEKSRLMPAEKIGKI